MDLDHGRLSEFAGSLGLSVHSLCRLGIGWSPEHRAWSFPMSDAEGNVLGIRLRRPTGFKFAVTGSKDGLFVPAGTKAKDSPLMVCEGPTDTAALLDLGFDNAVGRPSCTGGVKHVAELIKRRQPPEVVIVADRDEPGQRGAANLASVLVAYAPTVRVITPPDGIKDARAWLHAGGSQSDVEQRIAGATVRRLVIRTRTSGRKE